MTPPPFPLLLFLRAIMLFSLQALAAPPSASPLILNSPRTASTLAKAALQNPKLFGGGLSAGSSSSLNEPAMLLTSPSPTHHPESGGGAAAERPSTLAVGPILTVPFRLAPTPEEMAERMTRELEIPYVVALCYHRQMERRFKAGGPRPGTEERFRVLAACEQNNAAGQRMPNGSTYEQFRVLYLTLTSAQRQAYRDDFVQQMSSPPRSYPAALSKCMALKLFPDDGSPPPLQAPFTVILFFEICKKDVPQPVPRKAPPPPVPTLDPSKESKNF